jgi:hypothetical protein
MVLPRLELAFLLLEYQVLILCGEILFPSLCLDESMVYMV